LLNGLRAGKLDLIFGVLRRPEWAIDVQEEILFPNDYVVIARSDHPLRTMKRPKLRDLGRYKWIMPGPLTPRQQALRRLLASLSLGPNVNRVGSGTLHRAVSGVSA
jgi:DNA-binding transcriptional LysR family regulator